MTPSFAASRYPGIRPVLLTAVLVAVGPACSTTRPSPSAAPPASPAPRVPPFCDALSARASNQLDAALASARRHPSHAWRDVPPFNADETLNGYVEIPSGERRKWEFDIGANQLRLDRTIAASVGGYPVNYGFVPQTVACDGDPFDVLVLGPPIAAGRVVAGTIVGVLYMDDEKGPDAKVIITPKPPPGQKARALSPERQAELSRWFDAYKKADSERGRWSVVCGFGDAAEGRRLVELTHRFYVDGSSRSGDEAATRTKPR